MDRQSRTGYIRRMDMEFTGRQIQVETSTGQVPATHRASGKLVPRSLQFSQVPANCRRIRGRVCRSPASPCREVQVRGRRRDTRPSNWANYCGNETRRRTGEASGEGRLPLQLGRSFGHRSDLRGDEVSCRPAAIDVEFYSARHAEAAKLRVSKYQLHALRTGPFHDCDMPSERRHMPELWQAQPLGSSVQSQTWSKGPSTRQISTRSTTWEQQAEGKTATAQSPIKGRWTHWRLGVPGVPVRG